jgi:hypothetical protein
MTGSQLDLVLPSLTENAFQELCHAREIFRHNTKSFSEEDYLLPFREYGDAGLVKDHFDRTGLQYLLNKLRDEKVFSSEISVVEYIQEAKGFHKDLEDRFVLVRNQLQEAKKQELLNELPDAFSDRFENHPWLLILGALFVFIAASFFAAFLMNMVFDGSTPLERLLPSPDNSPFLALLGIGLVFIGKAIFACCVIGIAFQPFYFFNQISNTRARKDILKMSFKEPMWMTEFPIGLENVLKLTQHSNEEMMNAVRRYKGLLAQIDSQKVDFYFDEKRAQRSLQERLLIIETETNAAIATAKNLDEQHVKTEEVRLKYAKELIDLQRQVKAEDNQDLTDKLQLLQTVLGEGV